MALKDWGPLPAAKKQSEIGAAFEAVKEKTDLESLDKVKEAVYNQLKTIYKLNQAKFSTWQKFWSQSNYEKHVIYLQGLVDAELEALAVSTGTYSSSSKVKSGGGSGSGNGSGTDNGTGLASDSGMSTLLIVGIVAVVVILLIKKFKKK